MKNWFNTFALTTFILFVIGFWVGVIFSIRGGINVNANRLDKIMVEMKEIKAMFFITTLPPEKFDILTRESKKDKQL